MILSQTNIIKINQNSKEIWVSVITPKDYESFKKDNWKVYISNNLEIKCSFPERIQDVHQFDN